MRAISLWQPWASLWLTDAKIHETRHWKTDYRGPLLVHAAMKLVSKCSEAVDELCIDRFGQCWRRELPRGALIGCIDLVSMISSNEFGPALNQNHPNFICGDWSPNRWGWQRGAVVSRFERPIPYKGQQRFFSVSDELLRVLPMSEGSKP